MKSLKYCFMLFLVLISSAMASEECSHKNKQSVVLGWTPLEPKAYVDDQGLPAGTVIELYREMITNLGCTPEFRKAPWKRMLVELENGTIDAIPYSSYVVSRTQFGRYSKPYDYSVSRLYSLDQSQTVDLSDLNHLTGTNMVVGWVRGAWHGPEFDKFRKQHQTHIRAVANADKLLDLLLLKRVDFIIHPEYLIKKMIEGDNRYLNVRVYPGWSHAESIHFLFSKKTISAEFVEYFSNQLAK